MVLYTMVNYSSEFIDKRDKYSDDETTGGSLGTFLYGHHPTVTSSSHKFGGAFDENEDEDERNPLNDHKKAVDKMLRLSNEEQYNIYKASNLLHKTIDDVHDDDITGGSIDANNIGVGLQNIASHISGGSLMSTLNKIGHFTTSFIGGSLFNKLGNAIKGSVMDTVDLVRHPTPKNLVKLAAKGFITVSTSGNPLLIAAGGKMVDKGIDKAFGGNLVKKLAKKGLKAAVPTAVGLTTANPYAAVGASYVANKAIDKFIGGNLSDKQHIKHLKGALGDINKAGNIMSIVKMIQKDHEIMLKDNEVLSHFLHALEMCHKLSKNDVMKHIL